MSKMNWHEVIRYLDNSAAKADLELLAEHDPNRRAGIIVVAGVQRMLAKALQAGLIDINDTGQAEE